MNLQNRGAYYYNFFIYIKIIPFFVEKTAEPAFVVVVVYYYNFFIYIKIIPFFVEKTAEPAFVVVVVVVYYYMLLFCLSL